MSFRRAPGFSNWHTTQIDPLFDFNDESRTEYLQHMYWWHGFMVYRNIYKHKRYSERLEWVKAVSLLTGCNPGVLREIMDNYEYCRSGPNAVETTIIQHGLGLKVYAPPLMTSLRVFWNAKVSQARIMALLAIKKPKLKQLIEKIDEYDTKSVDFLPEAWYDCLTDINTWVHSVFAGNIKTINIDKEIMQYAANMEERTDAAVPGRME